MFAAYTVPAIRQAESTLMRDLADGALMQRAAFGLASAVVDVVGGAYGVRVVLMVGPGDNGGDALVAGAMLARRGARVDAVTVADHVHDAAAALRQAGGRLVAARDRDAVLRVMARADVVIDGIVGIGGRGGLRPAAIDVVRAIPSGALVIAVDVPSGVDADTGVVEGEAVRADLTVCMGALKPGLLVDPGADHAGVVQLVDLGLAEVLEPPAFEALDDDDARRILGDRSRQADKYAQGVVGVVAGSHDYPGAAVLVVAGALQAGAGYVRVVGVNEVITTVHASYPEAVATTVAPEGEWREALGEVGRVQSWVVGPGSGTDARAGSLIAAVLDRSEPVVLDADALTCLANDEGLRSLLRQRRAPVLLTPHAGELARLLGVPREDVEAGRWDAVSTAADTWGATVLLKGSTTLVADPAVDNHRSPVRINLSGTPALATAGSGDVLSGIAGALLARGLDARDAASAAAHLHGVAGTDAERSVSGAPRASDIAEHVVT